MKLLVATQFPYSAPGGGSAVIRQMLRGCPAELHWWSVEPAPRERRAAGPLREVSFSFPGKLSPERKIPHLKSWILENLWTPLAAAHLCRTLRDVRPDCVWVIPHNWSIPVLHRALVHPGVQRWHTTMQDYVDVHNNPQRFGPERCERMARMADDLYRLAETRDATSHSMLEDLEHRTGTRGAQMLHQGLEAEDFARLENGTPSAAANSRQVHIAYAGTILVEPEFRMFIDAIRLLRTTLDIRVDFYSAHSYRSREWFEPEWMKEHGHLSDQELGSELRKADWGFIPMALDDRDPRYNRFSFPTKFITYLAAGLPVITIGHPESSVMRMAAQYMVGVCSSARDAASLAADLAKPLREARGRFRNGILACAKAEFDAAKMRKILWRCLATGA